jgi:hypothetical protein
MLRPQRFDFGGRDEWIAERRRDELREAVRQFMTYAPEEIVLCETGRRRCDDR